jgi:dihydropteroate synthase
VPRTRYAIPAGLLQGRQARLAVAEGRAAPLAGLPLAFTHVEVADRRPEGGSRSTIVPLDHARAMPDIAPFVAVMADRRMLPGFDLSRPLVMGIVNVTPDSFSDGGRHGSTETAVGHGLKLAAEGADILDVGGESTRPGSDPVPLQEELDRVLPVIERLARETPVPVSVDTRKGAVMAAAAAAGARLLNDVSALTWDKGSLPAAAATGLPVCIMHAQGDPKTMQDNPAYDDAALDVFDYLEARIAACEAAGIARPRLIADPGIGFGKTFRHNMEIIDRVALYHGLGQPVLFGASRKGMIGTLTGEKSAAARGAGSVGVALAAALRGAHVIRVHDVRDTVHALKVFTGSAEG